MVFKQVSLYVYACRKATLKNPTLSFVQFFFSKLRLQNKSINLDLTIKLYRKVKLSQFRFSRFSTENNNNETSDKPEDHLIRALANTAVAAAGQ